MNAHFGPYKLIEKIGQGGMAEVFRVSRKGARGFEKPLALKKILPTFAGEPQFQEMLIHEAQLQVELSHPNLIQAIDFIEVSKEYGLILEYFESFTLQDALSALGQPIPWEVCVYILLEVLKPLHHIHNHKDGQEPVIHRDLSPQNILISKEGVIKISDFGIAWTPKQKTHTQTGVLKGKVAYLSPEQVGGQIVGPTSDLFSLGIVAYEMICGCNPFWEENEFQTLKRIENGDYLPSSERCSSVPQDLHTSLDKALAMQPADRYANALEWREDLYALQNPEWLGHGDQKFCGWIQGHGDLFFKALKPKFKKTRALPNERPSRRMLIGLGSALVFMTIWLWPRTISEPLPKPKIITTPVSEVPNAMDPPARPENSIEEGDKEANPKPASKSSKSQPLVKKARKVKPQLSFEGPEGTLVYINGKNFGALPRKAVSLSRASYIVMMRAPDGKTKTFKLNLSDHQTLSWK